MDSFYKLDRELAFIRQTVCVTTPFTMVVATSHRLFYPGLLGSRIRFWLSLETHSLHTCAHTFAHTFHAHTHAHTYHLCTWYVLWNTEYHIWEEYETPSSPGSAQRVLGLPPACLRLKVRYHVKQMMWRSTTGLLSHLSKQALQSQVVESTACWNCLITPCLLKVYYVQGASGTRSH